MRRGSLAWPRSQPHAFAHPQRRPVAHAEPKSQLDSATYSFADAFSVTDPHADSNTYSASHSRASASASLQ